MLYTINVPNVPIIFWILDITILPEFLLYVLT